MMISAALLSILLLVTPLMLLAADKAEQPAVHVEIQKAEKRLGVARVFSRFWARLRAYVPKPGVQQAATQRTQIAGVRGAETTASPLQPYWKGDKTEDPSYVKEIKAFHTAMELADTGDLQSAAEAFQAFATKYPQSSLNPNVQFALGLVYVELGEKRRGMTTLKSFTRTHPEHPLATDARQMIEQLPPS